MLWLSMKGEEEEEEDPVLLIKYRQVASLAYTSLKMDECPKPVRPSRKTSRGTTGSLGRKYDPPRTSDEN
ncbi:hypothetical protein O3M35_010302 [Rhynocoris fuscipes]|uniref:Uncharacterized protein n=1 Tax=Rhynocoris fuscipes TaxID=488301 RepID=A0AAW1CZQ9_9HEMI